MRRIIHILPLLVIIAAMDYSCSTTRRIPDGEYLYTGLKGIDILDDSTHFPEDLLTTLSTSATAPTNKNTLFLFPVGLWVYNNVNDSAGFIQRWIYDKYAQDPVLVSDARPELRTKMLDKILFNNGYFSSNVNYEIVHKEKSKRATLLYKVEPGPSSSIDSIILLPDTSDINHRIDSIITADQYLSKRPIRYSADSLSAVRVRITNSLRNHGYYYFTPNIINYLADTLMTPGSVAVKIDLASNIPPFALQKYITGDVTLYAFRHTGGGEPDTIHVDKATIIQMKPSRLRPQTVNSNISFRKGRPFSVRQMNNTQSYLSRLGIFNAINIEPVRDSTATVPTLNVNIGATFDAPLEASLEVNATSKSNSYLGPGLSFAVTNHNMFGGGEQFSVRLNGSYEWQTGKGKNRSVFNSYEAGIQASLAFPRLLAPNFLPRRRRQLNWTRLSLGADLLNRPHYFKMAQFNTAISYDWAANRYMSFTFTPFKLTYTKLMRTTEVFDSMMVANPAVALSFQSQFIPQLSLGLTYDRDLDRDNHINIQATATEAGNIFWSIYKLCGVKGEKRMFGNPFSQFIKGTAQIVWSRRIVGNSWLVSRLAAGAAHAYDNSSQVPYSEQFYCGGANSVRAFTVRSIGPGSYHDPKAADNDYFDQTGTFKFEANVEYRFPLIGPLNGAIFLDAGNVWLLKADPLRPGGLLRGKTFFKDIATGTGAGLRFDIGMLVLRADLGIGIHAPYDTGRDGYYNMVSFRKSLAFHLAIGYPF